MKTEKIILYLILLVATITGGILGFFALQNNRYTTFGHNNMFIWDNWKEEPVFVGEENSRARSIFDNMYKESEAYKYLNERKKKSY